MRWRFLLLLLGLGLCLSLRAAEVIPPAPRNHFNDYAGIVPAQAAARLNAELDQFERDTSNQILVAIYPHMQSDSSIEDYTVRVAQAWRVGQAGRKNGAVLFIFSQDRKLYIEVGYGLEGVLPDALCKRIVEDEITPRFRQGDLPGGVEAGVHALLAAVRGEYRGTGTTHADRDGGPVDSPGAIVIGLFAVILISWLARRQRNNGGTIYGRGGRVITYGGWGGGGGSSSGRSSGGGTFSGGGGSFGGGGAGGSW